LMILDLWLLFGDKSKIITDDVREVPWATSSDHNAAIQRITSADESEGTARHSNPTVPSERFTHTRAATFPRPSVRTSNPYARSSVAA
jgi:hypothetical protein